ncbi:MAG TPA: histidine kinase dimerization/phospho-acceptor domain-containing protein, partial [Usitatibacter sp.]|nr:histidine kinase dimerization/phospho-acceptor domain-containing protein [Usitatibacter sp.]
MKRPRAGLFFKYFAFIGLLVSAGLVASGAIGLYFSYQETRNSLVSLQREKALTAAVRIEHFLYDIVSQLGWTTLPMVVPNQEPMQARRLDFLKVLRQLQAVTEVTHLDGKGREQLMVSRLAMDRVGAGTDFSADPRFTEVHKTRTFNTGPTQLQFTGWFGPVSFRKETEPYMMISIPEARDRPGVTVVDVNLKFIWDEISRIRIGQKGLAYVVDDKGFLVAHPDISLVLRKVNLSNLPQVKEALAAKSDAPWNEPAEALDVNGERVISAYVVVESTGWRVFVEEPESAVFAPLYAAILRTALLLLAGVVISIAASVWLARRMVQPVRALAKGAERIGGGDLDSQIDVRTGDELEDLASRFNTMTAQLRESYSDLERKVQVRTSELREALDQQTATADVLKVISSSPTDVKPVFDAIVRSVRELGEALNAYAFTFDGERIHYVTSTDEREAWTTAMRDKPPWLPDASSLSGRVVLARRTMQIEDMHADPEYDPQNTGGDFSDEHRLLGVPMMRDGAPIGVLTVSWKEAGTVPEKFVRVLETFAAQAVIAVENVRLFNEIQEKSRQLEVANKHKSDFLANMSHELRTPLNAIIGFSEVMLSGMTGKLPDKQGEFITDIRDSGKHLLALINDILDLSKIEAGRMELDIARFDLKEAMANAMTLVRGRAERHGIKLDSDIDADLGAYDGDERKFKQIVLNLLTNAVKFTPEGGTVTMGARRVNGAYVFSVKDTGVGIA